MHEKRRGKSGRTPQNGHEERGGVFFSFLFLVARTHTGVLPIHDPSHIGTQNFKLAD